MATEGKPEYSPGLAGVIAGETSICWVDPNAGLMYRGYDIHDTAQKASFEEVAYLLLNGELPNGKQLVEFTQQIAAERALPGPVTEMLRLLPSATHPMDMLRTGVSMLSAFDKDLSDNSQHLAAIRKLIEDGHITEAWHHRGTGELIGTEGENRYNGATAFRRILREAQERWRQARAGRPSQEGDYARGDQVPWFEPYWQEAEANFQKLRGATSISALKRRLPRASRKTSVWRSSLISGLNTPTTPSAMRPAAVIRVG